MARYSIPLDTIEELLADVEHESVRTNYGGRGMYGETCLAVVVEYVNEFLIRLGMEAQRLATELEELDDIPKGSSQFYDWINTNDITHCAVDSMGTSKVVYWSHVTVLTE